MPQDLQPLIEQWGPIAVFAGAFFEGEVILVAASIMAGQGYLSPAQVWASAALGSWLGHLLWFFLGRWLGAPWLLPRWPRLESEVRRVTTLVDAHPRTAIFTLQYLYGVRLLGAIALGLTDLSTGRYLLYQSVNCAIWALAFTLGGVLLGEGLGLIIHGGLRWAGMAGTLLLLVLLLHRRSRSARK